MTKRSLQKLKPIRAVIIVLLLAGIFQPADMVAQTISKKYPKETLASRLLGISKDYDVNIGYRPEQCAFEIPELVLANADINQALEKSLASTGFIYEKKAEKTFVVQGKKEEPQKNVPTGAPGAIKGRIVEAETSEPLPGANVVLLGTQIGTSTDAEGYYQLAKVPSGKYTLEVSYIGFNKELVDVQVAASKTSTYDIKMSGDAQALSEVTVSAVRRQRSSVPHATEKLVVAEIKELQVVASGISSEQISKSADRNAAQAVAKVAGVSIVDDKFVIVRGLNQRYNLTYLNDNVAPSTETNSRSFALDLIPSRVIDKILVQKSPSPDNQADATGGVIKIYTKDAQAVKHFDIDFQLGYRAGTAFNKDFLAYNGGKFDFLGFDDGTRALPSVVPGYGSLVKAQLTPSQYANAFNPALTYGKKTALPNMQFTANYYDAYPLFGKTLSMLASLSYKNDNQKNYKTTQQGLGYLGSYGSNDKMGNEDQNTNTVQTNLLLNFTYRLNENNTLYFKNFLLQQGIDAVVLKDSWSTYSIMDPRMGSSVSRDIMLNYNQRFFYAGNLSGRHTSKNQKHELNWNGGYSLSRQETPDQRVIRLTGIKQEYSTSDASLHWFARGSAPYVSGEGRDMVPKTLGIISRFWSLNSDQVYNGSLDYSYKITPWLTAKTGTFHQWKVRKLDRRIYTVHEGTMDDPDNWIPTFSGYANTNLVRFRMQDLPDVWSETYLRDDLSGLQVRDRTAGSDTYRGTEQNNSAYFLLNFAPANRLVEIYGGIRYEYNRQKIAAAIPGTDSYPISAPILVDNPMESWLPSVNVNLRPAKYVVARASYGKTVNRTEFREVSPFNEMDFANNQVIVGNPDLLSAKVDNWDARLEFYPGDENGDQLSIGYFYKKIQNPIERINETDRFGGGVFFFPTISFNNIPSATVKGWEAELKKSFDFIPVPFLRNLSVSANVSFIDSEAAYEGTVREQDSDNSVEGTVRRPLQGQSPYLLNAGLYYENAGWGTKIGVIYNTSGSNIYAVSSDYIFSQMNQSPLYRGSLIELSRNLLDLSFTQRIGKGLQAKFTVQNLLDEAVTLIEDYNFTYKYEPLVHIWTPDPSYASGYKKEGEGDNIYSRYKPGHYFSFSISYSF